MLTKYGAEVYLITGFDYRQNFKNNSDEDIENIFVNEIYNFFSIGKDHRQIYNSNTKYKYKIILASPSTLISVLKIIDNMWSINERNKNADLIAGTALEIYSQVEKVYTAFENAGYELSKSMGSIETAKNRLRDGKGSLVSRVKKMIKLGGLKPDKEIPETEEISSTKIKKIK